MNDSENSGILTTGIIIKRQGMSQCVGGLREGSEFCHEIASTNLLMTQLHALIRPEANCGHGVQAVTLLIVWIVVLIMYESCRYHVGEYYTLISKDPTWYRDGTREHV